MKSTTSLDGGILEAGVGLSCAHMLPHKGEDDPHPQLLLSPAKAVKTSLATVLHQNATSVCALQYYY